MPLSAALHRGGVFPKYAGALVALLGSIGWLHMQVTSLEPVLVSAGPIATLRRAYPNFFLDIGESATAIEHILATRRNP